MNKDILLVTLNSTYQHSAFGLRYLFANLNEYQERAKILEFIISKEPKEVAEIILSYKPKIVGLGVYIWNTRQMHELVSIIKRISPQTIVVLGGPEVSHETETQAICHSADFVIKGEADFLFYEFCHQYFSTNTLPEKKFISGPLPSIELIKSPYSYYSEDDIKNRYMYVEASRGCPYKCEYCLSSLDKSVRNFNVDSFLNDIDQLIQKGARNFKFIDRTFNLSVSTCTKILQFFLDRIHLELFLHFEMVPDRLPVEIRELISRFPHGSLQFEIGIQTWNPEVAKLVSRRNDYAKVRENFQFLREHTGVHTHADLIVGLPGEDIQSFAQGFDELSNLAPDEIQVGILKRLKGTPIVRHDKEWQMIYQEHAPFQILSTRSVDFLEMQKMNRFAKYWDSYANSGQFKVFMKKIKEISLSRDDKSFFWQFYDFSEFLHTRHSQSFGISLQSLAESAFYYMINVLKIDASTATDIIMQDYTMTVKRDVPKFLKEFNGEYDKVNLKQKDTSLNKRQQRHNSSSISPSN